MKRKSRLEVACDVVCAAAIAWIITVTVIWAVRLPPC